MKYVKLSKHEWTEFANNLGIISDTILNFIKYFTVVRPDEYFERDKVSYKYQELMDTKHIIFNCIPNQNAKNYFLKYIIDLTPVKKDLHFVIANNVDILNFDDFYQDVKISEKIVNRVNENFETRVDNALEARADNLALFLSQRQSVDAILSAFKKHNGRNI